MIGIRSSNKPQRQICRLAFLSVWLLVGGMALAQTSETPQQAGDVKHPTAAWCNGPDARPAGFISARERFISQGHSIRPAGKIHRPSDLVGGIMFLGRANDWLYVTQVEMRHDPTQHLVLFARLEGYLPDGTLVSIDNTRDLPATFHPVQNWDELGWIFFKDQRGQQRQGQLQLGVSDSGLLTQVDATLESGSCMGAFGGSCFSLFCLSGTCKYNPGTFNCSCSGIGACFTQPALNCMGTCADVYKKCDLVFINPGAPSCACVSSDDIPLPENDN